MKPSEIYRLARGRFVTGTFVKKDGTTREFWGRLEYDNRHPRIITFYDMRIKKYRRISLDAGKLTVRFGDIELSHVA